jgi:hypothetical protein
MFVESTDTYGNPSSGYSTCFSFDSGELPYVIPIIISVTLALIIGNVVCFIARNDETVNNEILYITLAQANYLQIFTLAAPLTKLSEKEPVLSYTIAVFSILIAFGGLLFLIFLPKIYALQSSEGMVTITVSSSRSQKAGGHGHGNKERSESKDSAREDSLYSRYSMQSNGPDLDVVDVPSSHAVSNAALSHGAGSEANGSVEIVHLAQTENLNPMISTLPAAITSERD